MDKKTPKTGNQKRDISAVSLRAAFAPESANGDKRTAEVVWTTGAKVLRSSWLDGPFYEELSLDPAHVRMSRLNNAAPFLADHDGRSVAETLGVVESARLENGRGVATVRFAKQGIDPAADMVFEKIRDGIIQNVSVGYRIHKFEQVEGGDAEIPTFRATDWEPFEISAVAIGADDGAGFRSAEDRNTCIFIRGAEPKHEESNTMDEMEKRAAEMKAADEKRHAEIKAAQEAAAKAERERASAIRLVVRKAGLDSDLADKLVDGGGSVDKAREAVLDALAERSESVKTERGSGIERGEDSAEKFQRGATAWLIQKSGQDVVQRAVAAGALPKIDTDPGEFRGMSMLDIARETLERKGVKTRGMDRVRVAQLALTHTRAGGMATIGDFPVLFENVINKTLIGAYATTPDQWRSFCKIVAVPDFRAASFYRTGSFGVLDSKNEHGEFKNKSIPDGEKVSVSVGTKGNMIGLTREALINDDLGALTDQAAKLGRAAKLSVEVDVFAALASNSGLGPTMADGYTLFHANHANIGTAGAAISVTTIDGDRVLMAQQKDPSGNEYLNLRPEILVLPIGLGGAARVINNSQYDTEVSSKFQIPNKVVGLYREVVDSPRLSGTRRYSFASPALAPAFVVAFLEGQGDAPFLEQQPGWRTDGYEWKVRLDYGVAAFDWRGAVTNAGS